MTLWCEDANEFERLRCQLIRYFIRHDCGADAEDLASLAIEKSLLAMNRGQVVERSYAFAAARTIIIDHRRRKVSFTDEFPEDTQGTSTDHTHVDVEAFLSTLDALDRRVVELRLDGHPWTSIARQINVNKSAIMRIAGAIRIHMGKHVIA